MRRDGPGVVLGLHRSGHRRALLAGALALGVDALDTGYNYLGFTSHRTLAKTAGDLLPRFAISTKVGFAPGRDRAHHTLDPGRLRRCVEESARDLGRTPDLVFLHNPEHTLAALDPDEGCDRLLAACDALEQATRDGLCAAWGIATWNPMPSLAALEHAPPACLPTPAVLMSRAGLTVAARTLDAIDALTARLDLGPHQRWGMSPFGGDAHALDGIDVRSILRTDPASTPVQNAFRAAYLLPAVGRIAVGTDNLNHLAELVEASRRPVAHAAVERYRCLLRGRTAAQPEPAVAARRERSGEGP